MAHLPPDWEAESTTEGSPELPEAGIDVWTGALDGA